MRDRAWRRTQRRKKINKRIKTRKAVAYNRITNNDVDGWFAKRGIFTNDRAETVINQLQKNKLKKRLRREAKVEIEERLNIWN